MKFTMQQFAENQLNHIQERIETACKNAGRTSESVTLIGASKRQSPELINAFIEQGLTNLGENYLQEAIDKQTSLAQNRATLTWHFIGQIQSNKTKIIAENFDWVHGVDRLKIAQRLSKQNISSKPLNLLIQLNPDDEQSKGGVSLKDASELCDQIAQLDNIALRGFMMIPKARKDSSAQESVFASANELLTLTNQQHGLSMDTLSMGMSGDLEAAIAQGSTMIRIGTDLFGART